MKTGDVVIFFFTKEDGDKLNNSSQMAPAIVNCGWSTETLNISVLADCNGVHNKTSVRKATDLKDAIGGYKWATREQVESWGVDLSSSYNNLEKLADPGCEEKPADLEEKESEALPGDEGVE